MTKRILSVLLLVAMLAMGICAFAAPVDKAVEPGEVQEEAAPAETQQEPAQVQEPNYVPLEKILEYTGYEVVQKHEVKVASAKYDEKEETLTIVLKNTGKDEYKVNYILEGDKNTLFTVVDMQQYQFSRQLDATENRICEGFSPITIAPGESVEFAEEVKIKNYNKEKGNVFNLGLLCQKNVSTNAQVLTGEGDAVILYVEDIMGVNAEKENAVVGFAKQTGFWKIIETVNWQSLVMILIACVLLYLAIVKKFEPLLLLPIAFGMLLTNLLGADVFHEEFFAGGHVHWDMLSGHGDVTPGLVDYLYLGVKLGIYPCLIFIGVGAMTDFGPLIANPKSLLLGAAAQIGIFATFVGAFYLGFTPEQASSIGIIGGADGPTAIFLTSKLAPELLGPIAVAAYSYMALVPVIQPPIMKLLTTKKEREIVMRELRPVSKTEKIVFPIVVTIFVALLVPSAAPLVGCLMLGNLLKESGVCERLSKTVQNELMNIVTIFLGISVGATATATTFLTWETIKIIVMGVVAFGVATACGVLIAKFMNLFLKEKINPLIGSAGVSAVPMAARVSQKVGQEANPSNFLLMHAMGPNVAGVIGSAIAAGALLALFG